MLFQFRDFSPLKVRCILLLRGVATGEGVARQGSPNIATIVAVMQSKSYLRP